MTQSAPPSTRDIILKSIVTHTVTYFVMGALAFFVLGYERLYAETSLKYIMRQTTEPIVMAGPLFQPLRGAIFGVVFVLLRRSLFEQGGGWLRLWAVLVALGILNTFGPAPGSVEGMVYTTLPLRVQFIGLPEVLLQSLLLSFVVFHWVSGPPRKWLRWLMGSAFCLVILLSSLGLLAGQPS